MLKEALRDGPPSPEKARTPLPASTPIATSALRRLTAWFPGSANMILPFGSVFKDLTCEIGAFLAGAPSPGNVQAAPATVVIMLLGPICATAHHGPQTATINT